VCARAALNRAIALLSARFAWSSVCATSQPSCHGEASSAAQGESPRAYTSTVCTWVFVMAVGGAAVSLLPALVLKAGRSPLRGGRVNRFSVTRS
jgi:hypothetical protein